jgi:hypothetical protein
MSKNFTAGCSIIIMIFIGILISFYAPTSNSNESAIIYLKPYNLHNIEIGDYNFNCHSSMVVRKHFKAINVNNEHVLGTICANDQTEKNITINIVEK